ncbi:hypothetical protein B0H67DRAFT_584890 [Lasiosphaeris hirsuta]|uniref:Secreted protein n=1 Tax=Lasiosphaeris hirsuta TaxID=260670 RepID=A0AA40A8I3_9PEZI|nr:hypothetical protein B0H67DRAFT_584890 [Lasiosphaeris hirsuta]
MWLRTVTRCFALLANLRILYTMCIQCKSTRSHHPAIGYPPFWRQLHPRRKTSLGWLLSRGAPVCSLGQCLESPPGNLASRQSAAWHSDYIKSRERSGQRLR